MKNIFSRLMMGSATVALALMAGSGAIASTSGGPVCDPVGCAPIDGVPWTVYSGIVNFNGGTYSPSAITIAPGQGNSASVGLIGNDIGPVTFNDDAIIGDAGSGAFDNNLSTHNVTGQLILGNQSGGNGIYTIEGDSAVTSVNFAPSANGGNPNGALIVGNGGSGSFTQGTDSSDANNQVNVAGDLTLGQQSGSVGTYTLNSGTLTVGGQLAVGGQSTLTDLSGNPENIFTQNGGMVHLSGTANGNGDYVPVGPNFAPFGATLAVGGGIGTGDGSNAGGAGEYDLNHGSVVIDNNFIIGGTGTGIFNQNNSDTSVQSANFMTLGFNFGASGTYNLSDGTLTVGQSEAIGAGGTGDFEQTGGSNTVNSGNIPGAVGLTVGSNCCGNPPGSGLYHMTGGTLSTGNMTVGSGENGSFIMGSPTGNPTNTVYGELIVGDLGGSGSYSITGDASTLSVNFVPGGNFDQFSNPLPNGALIVGDSGTGTFVQGTDVSDANNQINVAGDVVLGLNSGGQGTYTLNSGTLTVGGLMTIGSGSTAANLFTQNGGLVQITGSANGNVDYAAANPNSVPSASTDSLYIGGESVTNSGQGTYQLNDGELDAPQIFVAFSGTGTMNQAGGLVKAGFVDIGDCGGCNGSNAAGYYNISGTAQLQDTGSLNIGDFGHGEFTQSDTSSVAVQTLTVGNGATATPNTVDPGQFDRSGKYTLNGGTLTASDETIGSSGTGTFIQNGGSNSVGATLTVGQQQNSTNAPEGSSTDPSSPFFGSTVFGGAAIGEYDLHNGTASANTTIVGDQGTGTFKQDGGIMTTATLTLGNNATIIGNPGYQAGPPEILNVPLTTQGNGTYNLSTGGTLNVTDTETVGNLGIGLFNQSGGTNAITNTLIIGNQGNTLITASLQTGVDGGNNPINTDFSDTVRGNGTYKMSGGTLNADGENFTGIIVGNAGTGAFIQTGGSVTSGTPDQIDPGNQGDLIIGTQSGSLGTYSITGNDSTLTVNGNVIIARDLGSAGSSMTIGNGTDTPTVTVQSLNGGFLTVGAGDAGTLTINSGSLNVAAVTYIGGSPTGIGTVIQTGGSFTTGNIDLGTVTGNGSPNNSYTLSNGDLTVLGALVIGSGTPGLNPDGSGGTFTQTGGSVMLGDAYINNGTYNLNGGTFLANDDVRLGDTKTGALFNQTAGNATITNDLLIGGTFASAPSPIVATYNLSGGTLSVGGGLDIGLNTPGKGTFNYNVNAGDSGQLVFPGTDQFLVVGDAGTGIFNEGSSTNTTDLNLQTSITTLDIGRSVGGNGTFNLAAGSTLEDDVIVGDAGTGTFNNAGGTHTVAGDLIIGNQATGVGTYNLTLGGLTTVSGTTYVGNAATGSLPTTYGGAFDNNDSTHDTGILILGAAAGSSGSYSLEHGGNLNVGSASDPGTPFFDVGQSGTGLFTQTGSTSTTTITGALDIGRCGAAATATCNDGTNPYTGAAGNGTFKLQGGSVSVLEDTTSGYGGFTKVGDAGTGALNISGGASFTSGSLDLATDGGTGTVTVDGSATIVTVNNLGVGDNGSGTFTQNDGKVTVNSVLDIGANATLPTDGVASNVAAGSGEYDLKGGQLIVNGDEIVGDAGTGKFDQTGGTHTVTGTITIQQNPGSTGEFDLANSTVAAGHITNNGTFSGFGTVTTSSGAQLVNTGLVHATGGTLTVTPGISGPTGNITIDSGAGLNLSSAAVGSSVATLNDSGAINLGSQNVTVFSDYNNANFGTGNSFNKHANVTTSGGQIDAAGNVGVSISGTGITGGTTATPTLALGNVHVGATTNATFNVNNTGSSGPVLRGAIQNTGLTAAGLSLTAANFGPIALGSSQAETLTANFATAGSFSGQSFKVVTNFDNVQDQTVSVTGTAYRLATGSELPNPVTVVNQHVGGTASQALTITNTAANDGFSEKLDASFGANSGNVSNNGGTISLLGPTASDSSSLSVGVDTTSAGHKTGSATVSYTSDGAGTSGLGLTAAGSSVVTISGDVYRLASASAVTPSPVTFGNVRVGTTDSQALTISNTAANDGFSEKLDASIGGATGSATTNSGSISLLGPTASDSSSLSVGVDTSSAGHKSGSATITLTSDGTGTSGLGNSSLGTQTVNVSGDVYRTAVGSVVAPVVVANQHVGGSATQALSVSNTATNDGFSEKLDASFGTNTGNVTNNGGSISLLGPTATNSTSLSVGVDTNSAGAKSGTATVNFTSNGTGTSGLASIGAGSQAVSVTGNVYNLASSSTIAPINLGVLHVGQGGGSVSQGISVTNTAASGLFSEGLDSSFGSYTNNGGTLNPTFNGSITNLTAGSTDSSSLQVTLSTGTAGSVSGNILVHQGSNGTIDGLANTALADQNPAVSGSVIATITNIAVAQINTTQPVNFGNVRVGAVVPSQALSITNAAPVSAFTESLIGNVVGTNNATVTASGGFGPPTANPELGGGETDATHVLVGIDTSTAGAKSGNAIIDFQSDGQAFSGGTVTDLGNTNVAVQGNVFRLATGSESPNPVTVVNQHVGGTASQALTITNTAANDGFSEKLDASFGANSGNVSNNGGTISLLGPTASDSSSLSVGVDTTSAGHKTGSATVSYTSDGAGTSGLGLTAAGSSVVTISGDVYRLASASAVTPSPVTFGNVRVGTTDSQALTISNTAANDGFSEKLDASIGGATGSATTNSGSISLLGPTASDSSSLSVGVDTSSAGHKSGSATITLTSDGTGTSGLGNSSLGTQTVNVSGDVYRTAVGSVVAPVVVANQHVGGSATQALSVSNTATNDGFSEKLDASFGTNTGNVTNNGGSISLLGPTATNSTSLSVGVDTNSAGAKSGTATVNFTSNGTGTSGLASIGAGSQAVSVTGNVYNLASSSTIAPINLGVLHVGQGGGSVSQGISVTNTAASGLFSEGLDSSFGSYTNNGGTLNPTFNGSITNLTAGSTDSSSLQVTLSTGTAGSVSGNILVHQGSNGTIDGLANTALADQNPAVSGSVIATITNIAVAQINTTQPVNFGNVRVGAVVPSQALSITNAAPVSAFTESLIGNVVGTNNATVTASGGFGPPTANPELGGGETDATHVLVGIDTSTAGAKSGNAIIDFQSDGTSFSGGTVTDLGNTNVAVQGSVYRLATGSATTPDNLGSARVGGTLAGTINVTNTAAPDGFSENLDASITASTLQVSSATGTVTGLTAGSSNNSGLQVAVNTGTSGTISGTATVQFMSDGSGIDSGAPVAAGSQVVTVTGKVYQTAVASVSPNPVDFGIIHVNQASVQTVTVANTAPVGLTDVITGGFSSVTGSFTGTGTLGSGVAAGTDSGSALQVGLDVATAGAYSGTANLGLKSHDADLSDVDLTTDPIGIEAQVNNYASLHFSQTGGPGSLSGGGSAYTLDFGNLLLNSGTAEAILEIFNCPSCDPNFTDLLSTAGVISNGSGYSLSGDAVSDLAGGAGQGGFDIGLSTDALGQFIETLTFAVDSSNPDFDGVIGDVTLTLEGNIVSSTVTSAPEPPSLVIFGTAILGLGFLSFLRSRKRAA